jgi:hypothetical protein
VFGLKIIVFKIIKDDGCPSSYLHHFAGGRTAVLKLSDRLSGDYFRSADVEEMPVKSRFLRCVGLSFC